MRLDHVAYRVKDRHKTKEFIIQAFGYRVQQEFQIQFPDGTTADCIALEPPEKPSDFDGRFDIHGKSIPWKMESYFTTNANDFADLKVEYHLPPEIFISDGSPGSIVGDWVEARGGIGGIHHLAYMVDSVEQKMTEWKEKGYAEFASEKPLTCPGLTQVFTKPSELTGVIFEFIERGEHGFCKENVAALMESTKANT